MKNALIVALAALAGFFGFVCDDNTVSPIELDDLELHSAGGWIAADLMPIVPPDPIMCQLTVIAKNTSATTPLTGLSMPEADVSLVSGNAYLGTISLVTAWDGNLPPGAEDTVHLTKVASPTTTFAPPCDELVYLDLLIRHSSGSTKTLRIDSLLFQCVY